MENKGQEKEENEGHFQIFRIPLVWGILIRLILWFYFPNTLSKWLDDRVEITTPITSFKRRKSNFYFIFKPYLLP